MGLVGLRFFVFSVSMVFVGYRYVRWNWSGWFFLIFSGFVFRGRGGRGFSLVFSRILGFGWYFGIIFFLRSVGEGFFIEIMVYFGD